MINYSNKIEVHKWLGKGSNCNSGTVVRDNKPFLEDGNARKSEHGSDVVQFERKWQGQ